MFTDPMVTIAGNLTDAPELRFTSSGTAVVSFTVAHNPRVKRGDEWIDGDPLFLRCTAWRHLAEHVAELSKGDRVIVVGTLQQRYWEDSKTGEQRTAIELSADDVGCSLIYATASIHKAARSNGVPAPVDPRTGERASERRKPAPQRTGSDPIEDEPPY